MRNYEAPRVASIRISDMLTELGPARATLYDGGDQCGGHTSTGGSCGTDGWWW